MERGFGAWSGVGFGRCATGARRLLNDGEFVLPFFQEGVRLEGEGFVGGGELPTVQRNGVGLEGVAGVGLGGAETRGDEGVEERGGFFDNGKEGGEGGEVVRGESGEVGGFVKEEGGEFFDGGGSGRAVNDRGDAEGKGALGETEGGVVCMVGEDLVDGGLVEKSVNLEEIFDGIVGLVEPELVEVENRGEVAGAVVGGGEPDGVAFGFAEFATGNGVDDEGGGPDVGVGVLEAFDEVDARGAVAILVGATELEGDAVGAIEVEEIVALDEGVGELGVRDAGAAGADAVLDELAVEELGHGKRLTDFAEEGEVVDVLEPVVVVNHDGGIVGEDAADLGADAFLVMVDFGEGFQVALAVFLRVANLAGRAADEKVGLIAVTDEAGAHHESGEVADGQGVGGRVGAPIELFVSTGVEKFGVFDSSFGGKTSPEQFFG